jgi:NADPH-dependent methylglyoxal reductase
MPFTSSSLVLVTGANGHVAQHAVSQLLEHPAGPKVRATVRSAASGKPLEDTFPSQIEAGRLEIVHVQDITDSNAITAQMSGVTHIAHVASPLVLDVKDVVSNLLNPAINGTTSVLEAAAATTSVESIVINGSFAGVFDPRKGFRPGYTYSSDDWNPITYEEAADPNLDLGEFDQTYQKYITYVRAS